MTRRVRYIAVLVIASLTGCDSPIDESWKESAPGLRYRSVRTGGGPAGFAPRDASKSGIDFVNRLSDEAFTTNRHYVNGSGVSLGDVDGNGYPDVYLSRLEGPNALFLNQGNWEFDSAPEGFGAEAEAQYSTGSLMADLDADGDLDIVATSMGGETSVFWNDGGGRFNSAPLSSGFGGTSISAADLDADGTLDLYVGNYKGETAKDLFSPRERSFDRVVAEQDGKYTVNEPFREHYRVELQKNRIMRFEYAEEDHVYLNVGRTELEQSPVSNPLFVATSDTPQPSEEWTLGVLAQDLNDDGLVDLFISNDFESPDRLWLGTPEGSFTEAPDLALRKTSSSTMSATASDIDRDGHTDLFLADMLSPEYSSRQMQNVTQAPELVDVGDITNRPQIMQNALLLNRGDGTWAEVANQFGLATTGWTWASGFLDVDLDGYEDLLVVNGHRYDAMDLDSQTGRRAMPRTSNWRQQLLHYPSLDLANMAFRNTKGTGFKPIPDGWGIGTEADVTHGMAFADLDNDGDLDIVTNRLNDSPGLFENTGSTSRVAVRLQGVGGNTRGVGARVTLTGGPVVQSKDVIAGGMYLSSSDYQVTFAADHPKDGSLQLVVDWPSGLRSEINDVVPNTIYEISESSATEQQSSPPEPITPLFVAESLDHVHPEERFNDFARQPLLNRYHSQMGPGSAVADLDGDGDDDLIITGGTNGGTTVLINDGTGQLSPTHTTSPDALDELGVVVIEQEGGAHALIARSNYEGGRGSRSSIGHYIWSGNRLREVERIDVSDGAIEHLSLVDYDGDGDLDLFAGAAMLPGIYPRSGESKLLRNDDNRFTIDEAASEGLQALGIVRGAAFGDLDGDGDPDGVIAEEWGSVRILRNDSGTLREATEEMGLQSESGWWQGISLTDINADGKLDIVASNWGLNSMYQLSDRELRVYHGDVDRNGFYDVVEAGSFEGKQGFVNRLPDLMSAFPFLNRRISTHEEFAGMSVSGVLGSGFETMDGEIATTLASSAFVQTDSGFESVSLPSEAQYAPGFSIASSDFDADGFRDHFVSQNFFAVRDGLPRLDAGTGLLLLGPQLETPTVQTSGVKAYGEQRGAAAADFDADGRADLIVTQNGAQTLLMKNQGTKKGLRVRLNGSPANPRGIGASVQPVYEDQTAGPLIPITAGSGYLSQNSATLIVGTPVGREITTLRVKWPDGTSSDHPVSQGEASVVIQG